MPKGISYDNLQRFKSNLDTMLQNQKDVLEFANQEAFPETGDAEKIYIDLSVNAMFRWDDTESEYVSISSPENIKYTPQDLSGEQKTQARTNIGAASDTVVSGLSAVVSDVNDRLNNFGNFVREVQTADGGIKVIYDNGQTPTIPTGLVFNGAEVDDQNYLYLTNNNVRLSEEAFTPVQLPAGGGGGGGGPVMSISDLVKPTTVRNGESAVFSFVVTSTDASDEITVKWGVNNEEKATESRMSGSTFSFDAGEHLRASAENTINVSIECGEAVLTKKWKITSVAFSIEWGSSISAVMLNTSNTNILAPIIVSAEENMSTVVKVVVGETTITRTAIGSMTLNIELNKSLFETGVNLVTASMAAAADPDDKADDIHFTVIWGAEATRPVVAFANSIQECVQYDLVDIEYFVFDPNNETATYTLQIGEDEPKQLTAGRTMQKQQYSPMSEGTVTIALMCGTAQASMQLVASQSPYNLSYYSDDSLKYVLDPVGHSNSDADRESFGNLIFSENFDWENGGFRTDSNGVPAFVVKKGNTVTMQRCLFEDDDVNGKTIDLSFRITNSDQYDAVAMQELNDGSTKGIILRANNGELRLSNVAGKEFRYSEESRIDLSVLVEKEEDQRIVTIWLDGIPANVNKYTAAGMLVQDEHAMVIGSQHCDVWLYAIRVYNAELNKRQMIQNYVSLGNSTEEKVNRYKTNTILDNKDKISVADLHRVMPNLTIIEINTPRMTTSKNDPVPADITITDGTTVLELAAATGPETGDGTVFKVQGTSSAAYGRSAYNLDIDFKGTKKKYKISPDAIAVNYLNVKVNVASSENANNVNAVDWYNTFQPYLTESRSRPGVRDVVEGKPCAVFITNTADTPVWFSSLCIQPDETVLYAMGDLCNSKKNKAVFGQDGAVDEYVTHPTKACIEVSGNDTECQRFRSTEAVYNSDKKEWQTTEQDDQGQDKKVKQFEWRMEPSTGDLEEVVSSWDDTVAWVVSTIGDSAKFKAEVGDYFAIRSLLYHFLFIEYFAGYDNVSKNTFYSYDYDATAEKYLWNIKAAYDMDTILAADNDGIPFGDYGLDYGDTVNGQPDGRQYFNAVTNTIFVNIKEAFQSELSSLYTSLRSAGAWNAQNIIAKWDTYQSKRPHASMILDCYNKYIEPYKTTGVVIGTETKGYDESYLPRLNGSKTYWRKQFLTYQTSYMDGKYGYYDTSNTMNFRTNGAEGYKSFEVKAYAKTYITMIKDSNKVASQKVEAGQTTTFNNVSVGNNTTMYVTPDRLVQYVRPLNETQNSTFVASGATKLTEAILGSETANNDWPATSGISIPSVILKDLSIQNLTNFSDAVSLSNNVELETLDTRGTNAGLITLPSFAPLVTVKLNACTGIAAYNLNKVETFEMASGSNLVSIRTENCNSVVSTALATYLRQAVASPTQATRRIRAIGINWRFNDLDVLSKVASTWKGYNSLGREQNAPVVTGTIYVSTLSKKKLEVINNVWGEGDVEDHLDEEHKIWTYGDLTITYDSLISSWAVDFMNMDGTAILDKKGQPYVQYVDNGGTIEDPIPEYVNEPTLAPTAQYSYTFTGWDNLSGQVFEPRTVTATYDTTERTYTVRWLTEEGGTILKSVQVPYGTEVVYEDPVGQETFPYPPTKTDEEQNYYYSIFKGWDKSTGFITENVDAIALWERGTFPTPGTALKNMTVAQIYAACRNNRMGNYVSTDDEHGIDIKVGHDFNFSNVESEVLLENRYFNGNEILRMDSIKLFDENAPSFTLAVDYEFCDTTSGATLISCSNYSTGSEGFRVSYYSTTQSTNDSQVVRVSWGDRTDIISHGLNRTILVLRHRKGSKNLYVASDNGGRRVLHTAGSGYGEDEAETTDETYRFDAYYPAIHYAELPRTQETNTNACLSFGAEASGTSGMTSGAKGWIHWCKIWYDDLGTNVIKQLASWPRETWRMQYIGAGRYAKADAEGNLVGATFMASAPLPQVYEYYPDSSTSSVDGSWQSSPLRTLINSKCFNALPVEWQSIISPVYVTTTKLDNDNNRISERTIDKLYIPAHADLTTNGVSAVEGSVIPWFATDDANNKRLKFAGINISEDLSDTDLYRTSVDDPTLYTDRTVVEGTIWIRTTGNNRLGYIYISADTAAKHGWYGGRAINDSKNNIVAAGAQGGMWIKAKAYFTRTVSSKTNHYIVMQSGVLNATWAQYPEYRRKHIVLMFSV